MGLQDLEPGGGIPLPLFENVSCTDLVKALSKTPVFIHTEECI